MVRAEVQAVESSPARPAPLMTMAFFVFGGGVTDLF